MAAKNKSVQSAHQPSPRELLALDLPAEVRLSPAGSKLAYSVRTANWKDNRYETLAYIFDEAAGAARQVTRQGKVNQMEWLDESTLAVLRAGEAGPPQVWLYEGGVGEGWQVTTHKTGVEWFQPFAGGLVFLARQPEKDERKARKERYGRYVHFEQEDSASALYYLGLRQLRDYQRQLRAANEDESRKLVWPVVELSRLFSEPLAIKEVVVSPAGEALYLNCWRRDDLVYLRATRVFRLQLQAETALAHYLEQAQARSAGGGKPAEKAKAKAKKEDWSYLGQLAELHLPAGARVAAVAPDGAELLIGYKGRDQQFYTREDLWLANVQAVKRARTPAGARRAMTNLTGSFDREMLSVYWTAAGIFGDYADGTRLRLARLDRRGRVTPLELEVQEFGAFHVSQSGRLGLSGANAARFAEIYLTEPAGAKKKLRAKRLTDFSRQVEGWDLGTVETIRWPSRDGVEIEGVLRKPKNFDPRRKYPLVFVVHGGPTWFSSDVLLAHEDLFYYPAVQFNHQDVLVLKPNYRGSIGRGQAFEELNVNNLGVGDLWDLESAVDHLVGLGWVDPKRVGCMGWSQGGYISAFAGLHSSKFKAVSVGAGISDWYTYHISNDIPDFTRDYLSGSPFRDRALYHKTAPMSNITNAKTPTLIQHGSDDQRVPLSNATELYRGLKEMGVPVELFIFPGMTHPITRPRENHAVLHQNLSWFSHYLLGAKLKLE